MQVCASVVQLESDRDERPLGDDSTGMVAIANGVVAAQAKVAAGRLDVDERELMCPGDFVRVAFRPS